MTLSGSLDIPIHLQLCNNRGSVTEVGESRGRGGLRAERPGEERSIGIRYAQIGRGRKATFAFQPRHLSGAARRGRSTESRKKRFFLFAVVICPNTGEGITQPRRTFFVRHCMSMTG